MSDRPLFALLDKLPSHLLCIHAPVFLFRNFVFLSPLSLSLFFVCRSYPCLLAFFFFFSLSLSAQAGNPEVMGAGNLHETNAYLLLYERTPPPTSRHRGRALKQSMVPPSATSWRAAKPHHETPPASREQRSTASGAVSAAAAATLTAGAVGVGAVNMAAGSALFPSDLSGARSNGGTSHAATAPGSSSTVADGGGSGGGGVEPPGTSDLRPRLPGAPSSRASDGIGDRAPPGGSEERALTDPATNYPAAAAAAGGPAGELGDSPGRGSATEGSNGVAPHAPGTAGSAEGGGAGGRRRRFSGRTDSADWGWSSDCGVR